MLLAFQQQEQQHKRIAASRPFSLPLSLCFHFSLLISSRALSFLPLLPMVAPILLARRRGAVLLLLLARAIHLWNPFSPSASKSRKILYSLNETAILPASLKYAIPSLCIHGSLDCQTFPILSSSLFHRVSLSRFERVCCFIVSWNNRWFEGNERSV